MRKEGLEPSRGFPLDPKSSASANSATFALVEHVISIVRVLLGSVNGDNLSNRNRSGGRDMLHDGDFCCSAFTTGTAGG